MYFVKVNSLKAWTACLENMNAEMDVSAKDKSSFYLRKQGSDIEFVCLKPGDKVSNYKGITSLTLEKIVDISKQISPPSGHEKELSKLGLEIGFCAFTKEVDGKIPTEWSPSFLSRVKAIWHRFCNLIFRGEFKTGSEIAQAYARKLFTFDKFPSSIVSNVEACIKDHSAKIEPWQADSVFYEKMRIRFLESVSIKATENTKVFSIWMLTGKSISDSIALGKKSSSSDFVGIEALKKKQKGHLEKLKGLAQANQWQFLQEHISSDLDPNQYSGFDWWMFPVNRHSQGQGGLYQLGAREIELLKKDEDFIKNYREGVILVTKSWGWDLELNKDISNTEQRWTDYQVRLGKMAHSLVLLEQTDLLDSLRNFVQSNHLVLQPWVAAYLK